MSALGRTVFLAAAIAAAAGTWFNSRPPPEPPQDYTHQLSRSRALSADSGLQLAPRFSHDGTQVAYALAEGGDSRIVVQALDGSARRFVGAHGALRLSPVFYPDGQRIAFWKGGSADGCAIVEHHLGSAAERMIADCSLLPRVRFDLSPDGRTMVFTGNGNAQGAAGLWLVSLDTGERRKLTTPPTGADDDLHPRFSPDGRRIAFFRGADGLRKPWIVSLGDGVARAASARHGSGNGLAWSSQDVLLVATDWSGTLALNELDLGSGKSRPVGGLNGRFPDVSRRGDLVYENVAGPVASNLPVPGGYAAASHESAMAQGVKIDLRLARR